jgi:hypothetical protein
MRSREGLIWRMEHPFGGCWLPIASAPRDGRVIRITDFDTMSIEMAWNPTGSNPLVSRTLGIWETVPTVVASWCEDDGFGPTHWRPCDAELQAFLLEICTSPPSENGNG